MPTTPGKYNQIIGQKNKTTVESAARVIAQALVESNNNQNPKFIMDPAAESVKIQKQILEELKAIRSLIAQRP